MKKTVFALAVLMAGGLYAAAPTDPEFMFAGYINVR